MYVLNRSKCEAYLGTEKTEARIKAVLQSAPHVPYFTAPKLDGLLGNKTSFETKFERAWDEAKDDPWLVFHSSGTTGELSYSDRVDYIITLLTLCYLL